MKPREKKVWGFEELRLTHCYRLLTACLYSLNLRQAWAKFVRMVSRTQNELSGWHFYRASSWYLLASL